MNVHHLNYDNLWNEVIELDLVTLCRNCHKRFHEYIDQYQPEIKQMNRRWKEAASDAIRDITIEYRTESGKHLANVIHSFIGDKANPNIARIIKVFMLGLGYEAGYTNVYPRNVKQNTYTIAAQSLSAMRKNKI